MTETLQKALKEISKLPAEQQDAIGEMLLEGLASDRKWDELFAKYPDQLAKLADQAMEEDRRGETTPLDDWEP
jgi:hypothetical protein